MTQASAAAAHAAQLEEQKRAVAQAHRIVHEQTQYIDRLVREQEKLRAELSAGEAEPWSPVASAPSGSLSAR